MSSAVQRAVRAIIRPPRKWYDIADLPLYVKGDDDQTFCRYPVTMRNARKQKLVGSIYHAAKFDPFKGGPCVVYLHGNASSQLEGQFLVPNLCPHGIFVFCFDFAGCGNSEGKYVSLGWFERKDTEFLLDALHRTLKMGPFVLWGRSMGASTSLLVKNEHVVGRVVDSAFTSVRDMCAAIATNMQLPGVFVSVVLWYLKKKVSQEASFDIDSVAPILVDNGNDEVPAVFGHAEDDQFIPVAHCRQLHEHYAGKPKYIMFLEDGHNGKRPLAWISLGVSFCLERFGIAVDNPVISECRALQEASRHFDSFRSMVKISDEQRLELPVQDIIVEFEKENPGAVEGETEKKHKRRKHRHHHHRHHRRANSVRESSEDLAVDVQPPSNISMSVDAISFLRTEKMEDSDSVIADSSSIPALSEDEPVDASPLIGGPESDEESN